MKIKRHQIYGIVSIVIGIIMIIPLVLNAMVTKIALLGSNGTSFFSMIGDMSKTGADTWFVLSGVFALFTILMAATLILVGISFLLSYKLPLTKRVFKISTVLTGVFSILAAVFAIVFIASTETITGIELIAGAGTYMLMGFGIILVVLGLCLKRLLKLSEQKEQTEQVEQK